MSNIEIGIAETAEEKAALFGLRMTVFVEEQLVPEDEEIDAYDFLATHFYARALPDPADYPEGIIGAARLVEKGDGVGKVGRVAIAQEYRGRGIGAQLMQFIAQTAQEMGFRRLILDAQCSAITFYEKLGYTAEGDIFLDANIEHRFMFQDLPLASATEGSERI